MPPAVFRKATNRNAICRQSPPHLPSFATQNMANRKAPGNQTFTNTHKQHVKTAARHDPDSAGTHPKTHLPYPAKPRKEASDATPQYGKKHGTTALPSRKAQKRIHAAERRKAQHDSRQHSSTPCFLMFLRTFYRKNLAVSPNNRTFAHEILTHCGLSRAFSSVG